MSDNTKAYLMAIINIIAIVWSIFLITDGYLWCIVSLILSTIVATLTIALIIIVWRFENAGD